MTTGQDPPSASPGADAPLSARAVVEDIQAAFRRGDYASIAARYDDDVDWLFYGPPSVFSEIGHRRGKVAVFEALHALNMHYRIDRHVTEWLIGEGDRAARIADLTLEQRDSGRIIRCRIANFHQVRNGRVIEYRGFTDSFDAAEQVLGHELSI
jgi:ketosteroid isomerase-like protein